MKSKCAIQQTIYLLKKCFDGFSYWLSQKKIFNDDFMLSLLEIIPIFWLF